MENGRRFASALSAGLIGAMAGYVVVVRPWMLTWGTTPEERATRLPGDEIVRTPRYQQTHAITVAAPPERVWPWLVQIGQGRGGLYSYDWLENLVGSGIHSVDRIVPALQTLSVGDVIRLVRADHPARLYLVVDQIDAPRSLVLRADGGRDEAIAAGMAYPSWAFVLRPTGHGGTRLLVRWRHDFAPTFTGYLTWMFGLEPVHFVMERAMLRGIGCRAEAVPVGSRGNGVS